MTCETEMDLFKQHTVYSRLLLQDGESFPHAICVHSPKLMIMRVGRFSRHRDSRVFMHAQTVVKISITT